MSTNTTPKETRWITWPKIVGGLATAIVAVLGLIYLLLPGCKPSPPAGAIAGRLSNIDVTNPTTWKSYTDSYAHNLASKRPLDEKGVIVRYTVELWGERDKKCSARVFLADSTSHKGVEGAFTQNFTPEADYYKTNEVIWLPTSGISPGTYYVYIELYDKKSQLAAQGGNIFPLYGS